MAKQSGLHQLRGKVGEHSYYKQTGVQSGLVRSINQGMSQRVKTSAEYANVRLNNAEFGQGGRLAAVLAQYITPKYRPMILPFSQSKMAKIILEYIKNDTTAPWGQRNITAANSGEMQVSALNAVVKNRFDDYGLKLSVDEETSVLTIEATSETLNKFSAIGADGCDVRFLAISTWIGTYDTYNRRYDQSFARANIYDEETFEPQVGDDISFTYTLRPAPPAGWPAFAAMRTGLVILLPYRTINGQKHTLQEHCSFKAFILEDGDVN